MKVVNVPIEMIVVRDRARPVNTSVAERLARDIEKRGLRQPIEVVRIARTDRYILVSGGHRLEACRRAGLTEIPASVISGGKKSLLRDELMENLARSDLSKLERCLGVAELKKLFLADNPAAKAGGNRQSTYFKDKKHYANVGIMVDWYSDVALRSDRAVRSIQREASIGERLSPDIIHRLRGTVFEDNQQELELLSKQSHSSQARIVKLLSREPDPAPNVATAISILDGSANSVKDPIGKAVNRTISQWNRSHAFRLAFIAAVPDEHLAPLLAERGYVPAKDIK